MAKPFYLYLAAAARKVWRWSPERREVLKSASLPQDYWRCAGCAKKAPKVQIDHVIPVGPSPKGFTGWDEFYRRLFCEAGNLRALCVPCHRATTKKQAKERVK